MSHHNLKDLALLAVLGFFIAFLTDYLTSETLQAKLDNYATESIKRYEILRKEIAENNTAQRKQYVLDKFNCSSCHSQTNNPIPKGRLNYSNFKCYLENTCRWTQNPNLMPTFKLEEAQMQELFLELYE